MPETKSKKREARHRWTAAGRKQKKQNVQPVAEGYWPIRKILKKRIRKKVDTDGSTIEVVEYLVDWVGDYKPSWEPDANLSDLAQKDAFEVSEREAVKALGLLDTEEESYDVVNMDDTEGKESEQQDSPQLQQQNKAPQQDVEQQYVQRQLDVQEQESAGPTQGVKEEDIEDEKQTAIKDFIDWTDKGLVSASEIERISIHDADAQERVTHARIYGIPICLTGHKGWAQFAKPWLNDVRATDGTFGETKTSEISESEGPCTTTKNMIPKQESSSILEVCASSGSLLEETYCNKQDEFLLDLSQRHTVNIDKMIEDIGDEQVPILRKNYDAHSPIKDKLSVQLFLESCWLSNKAKNSALYLHQWLFTESQSAVAKLCNVNKPIPHLGEDLLKHCYDEKRCAGDSPFQYIFMGNAGTMSKMHSDPGGLLISIAPIVGQKEVVLVHRSDGRGLVDYEYANVEKPDLCNYPLLYSTRVWKSVISPGEILLMPQGTYHQCRNVTPCLSYHYFHLDSVNLRAFYESWRDQTCAEIPHYIVIWNATRALQDRLDDFVSNIRACDSRSMDTPTSVANDVTILRKLVCISREMAMHCFQTGDKDRANHFDGLVVDAESTLHNFRYRCDKRAPLFRARQAASSSRSRMCRSMEMQPYVNVSALEETVDLNPAEQLQQAILAVPQLSPDRVGFTLPDHVKLDTGDRVKVQLYKRCFEGTILSMQDGMLAAMLHYEGYDSLRDEFWPIEKIRVNVAGGEPPGELRSSQLKEGMRVLALCPDEQNMAVGEYPAVICSWRCATFYRLGLTLGPELDFCHWLPRDCIMHKLG